ncbi:MAG: TIGR03960 family B12-binding radical SAM protein [Candidatus Omnitrophota bacterium]
MDSLNQILNKVQKPGRYVGGETNQSLKRFSKDKFSVALAYPDAYEVGMSYLGLRILYHLLNERDDIVCERVFMPWKDMEEELKDHSRKLFSLESKTAINKFDIVGFSLSYELTYTNVLSMLHLGGITLPSKNRREDEPLIIAGGACCYNPEPMSAFIDVFIIGDAEEVLPKFIDEYRRARSKNHGRKKNLKGLSGLEGVYVPSLYEAEYSGGRFLGIKPTEEGVKTEVKKATVTDLENAYYPVKQIMPLVKIVHDRIAVEVMRGCPNRCRFCQAGSVNRPVRIRTPDRVRDICQEVYKHTGCERIALLSLSSVNYPFLADLVRSLNRDFHEKGVGISIPSLRVDEAFYGLPEMISTIRKAGLTFAPESASAVIRESLGKDMDSQVLCKSALLAFRYGWRRMKLYFMVGFPGEPQDEAEKIVKLARELSVLKKTVSGGAAEIKVSVNPFIPKAHTPFQWLGMKERSALSRVKEDLLSSSSRKIQVEFHNLDQSLLEACLSRGDRRLSGVIYTAWQKGARMDSWTDFFNFKIWEEAFSENGLDIHDYARRHYALRDILPWSHINTGVDSKNLEAELEASGFREQIAAF